jgi:hypothetical protein
MKIINVTSGHIVVKYLAMGTQNIIRKDNEFNIQTKKQTNKHNNFPPLHTHKRHFYTK